MGGGRGQEAKEAQWMGGGIREQFSGGSGRWGAGAGMEVGGRREFV